MIRLFGAFFPAGIFFLAGISPSLAQEFPAGDASQGRKLARQCSTCHGLDGVARIPIAPNLAGESALYLHSQLEAFRSGAREHEMMNIVSKSLSDRQIADLSAWYSSLSMEAVSREAPEDAPELCSSCHGADGKSVIEDAPHLAGESAIYIDAQLKAFRSGKRKSEIMEAIAAEMSDAEIRAAANWYAETEIKVDLPQ